MKEKQPKNIDQYFIILIELIFVQLVKKLYNKNIICLIELLLYVVIIKEVIDLPQQLITTRPYETLFICFLIVLNENILIVVCFLLLKLFSLLDN